jgi:hypothetical protein
MAQKASLGSYGAPIVARLEACRTCLNQPQTPLRQRPPRQIWFGFGH